jgi:hypothetical protein
MQDAEGKLASNPLLAENYEVPSFDDETADKEKAELKADNQMSGEIIKHIRETFVPEEVESTASVECTWLAE